MKRILSGVLFLVLALSSCDGAVPSQEYQVLRTLPHDPQAYTQGLLFHDGMFFESTGRRGESSLRKVDPETGEILAIHHLPDEYFGEGLARVGDELIQLTWQSGIGFVYDAESFDLKRTFEYDGEGWGLCYDGESLFMSDGGDKLKRRDPATFQLLEEIGVTEDGFSVWKLNELECVGDEIFANVFQTNRILRIDKHTGEVKAELDGYGLSVATKRTTDPEAVFNGIAYDPATGHLYVTGKLWPSLFELEIPGG